MLGFLFSLGVGYLLCRVREANSRRPLVADLEESGESGELDELDHLDHLDDLDFEELYDHLGTLAFPIDLDYWAKAARVSAARLDAAVYEGGKLTETEERRLREAARRFLEE